MTLLEHDWDTFFKVLGFAIGSALLALNMMLVGFGIAHVIGAATCPPL